MITLFYDDTSLEINTLDTSSRYRSIMGEDSLTLKFEDTAYLDIPVGAYCDYEGRRYTLLNPSNFTKAGSRQYSYTLILEGSLGVLRKYKMRDMVDKQLKFSLTAKPHEHIELLVNNLNEREAGWTVGDCIENTEKLVSYNHTSLDAALHQITEAFETEWEIVDKTIHLRKVAYNQDNPLVLSYGKGNGFRPNLGRSNMDESTAVEILFVQGGDRNINWSEYGSRELLLPKNASLIYEGRQYITDEQGLSVRRGDKDLRTFVEDSLDCSHIYPSRVGTISEVEAVRPQNNLYDFFDTSIPEDLDFKACLIAGQTLTVRFETGMLAGREFDVDYKHGQRRFLLVSSEEDGVTMPNETFKPNVGDKYAVFGMMMPEAYISNDTTQEGASWDMFREAAKYLYEHEEPRFSFTGELDGIWAKQNWLNVGGKIVIGGYVRFSDPEFQPEGIDIRIVGVRDTVNNPHSPVIELSNAPVGSSVANELKKIASSEVTTDGKIEDVRSFTKRRYREAAETIRMLGESIEGFSEGIDPISVQTMSMLVGSEALQFRFVNSKTDPAEIQHQIEFDGGNKIMTAPAGIVQHMTLGVTELKAGERASEDYLFWDVAAFNSPPLVEAEQWFFIYLKADKAAQTAVFYLSEEAIKMDSDNDFYYFLVGFLNSESEGERSFVRMYGFTEILPARITTSKIHADTIEVNEVLAGMIYATGAQIDGNLLVEGTVTADQIDVTGLFAEEIFATNITVTGAIGGFKVDNVISSQDEAGRGIIIDPSEFKIAIENKSEGQGVSAVVIKADNLTPYLDLTKGSGGMYNPTVNSQPFSIKRTSHQLQQSSGQSYTVYLGQASNAAGMASGTVPLDARKINISEEKNYTVDLRYIFAIQHNGDSAHGRTHKIHGNLTVKVTSTLIGVTASGTTKTLVKAKTDTINISRSNQELYDEYGLTRKTSFNSDNCVRAYWKLDLNMQGDLTYQRRRNDIFGRYWSSEEGWEIEFENIMGKGSDFYPSIGVTELTTSGFQSVWATNRYFRIDGNDPDNFIRTEGVWRHNGNLIATVETVQQALPDLTPYILRTDLENSYYDKTTSNSRFHSKGGANNVDFDVRNLTIHGVVNQWLAQSLVVEDARIQVKRKQDGATVAAGLDVFDGSSVVSSLHYGTDSRWKIGGQNIATETWVSGTATAYNAARLGGIAAADYARKSAPAAITGAWKFKQGDHTELVIAHDLSVEAKSRSASLVLGRDASYYLWRVSSQAVQAWGNIPELSFQYKTTDGGAWNTPLKINMSGDVSMQNHLSVGKNLTAQKGYFSSDVESTSKAFIGGFSGKGWKLDSANDRLTVDYLTVRKSMDVYELVVNQIRGTNGALIVSDTAKVNAVTIHSSTVWTVKIDTRDNNKDLMMFVNGDVVRCQVWTSTGGKYYQASVSEVNLTAMTMKLTRVSGTSTAEAGDVIARVDSGNQNRRGYIYLTSSDNNSPYLDVVNANRTRVRLGRLDGISGQSGYGLWGSTNGSDTAFVISSDGYAKIAGWDINADRIQKNLNSGFIRIGQHSGYTGMPAYGIQMRSSTSTETIELLATDTHRFMKATNPGGGTLFILGTWGNQIAGINFNDSRLSTSKWWIDRDGSFSFGGGKITGDASGNVTIDGSLITKTINTNYIEGLNLEFTKGKIAGFDIFNNQLINSSTYKNVALSTHSIHYMENNTQVVSSIGLPANYLNQSDYALGHFKDIETGLYEKKGLVFNMRNATFNYALYIESGDIRINKGNIRCYEDWHLMNLSSQDYNYMPINKSLKFLIKTTGSGDSTLRLPTKSQILNSLGMSSQESPVFDVVVKCKYDSTRQLIIQPNSGVYLYNFNGGTMGNHVLAKGDSVSLMFDGSHWNLLWYHG